MNDSSQPPRTRQYEARVLQVVPAAIVTVQLEIDIGFGLALTRAAHLVGRCGLELDHGHKHRALFEALASVLGCDLRRGVGAAARPPPNVPFMDVLAHVLYDFPGPPLLCAIETTEHADVAEFLVRERVTRWKLPGGHAAS